MLCPVCAAVVRPGDNYCHNCTFKLPDTISQISSPAAIVPINEPVAQYLEADQRGVGPTSGYYKGLTQAIKNIRRCSFPITSANAESVPHVGTVIGGKIRDFFLIQSAALPALASSAASACPSTPTPPIFSPNSSPHPSPHSAPHGTRYPSSGACAGPHQSTRPSRENSYKPQYRSPAFAVLAALWNHGHSHPPQLQSSSLLEVVNALHYCNKKLEKGQKGRIANSPFSDLKRRGLIIKAGSGGLLALTTSAMSIARGCAIKFALFCTLS